MAKEVSVGVKVKLEADAKEMQRIIDDLESRLSNIKPGTSLEKTLTKQLQQLKAQAGDFSLISGQQIINQSDLATAANIAKRFFRDVGRVSDSYEKAPFSSLQFTDDQLKNLKKAEKALEDFKAKSKDSLSKKTTGEVFDKYAEDAKKIQQTSAKLQKSFAMDDSFEETKKRIQKSKEQAEKDVELTNKKLTLKRDEKLAAESAKKTAEANFNQKKAELAKTYKLEESFQKKADLAKNVSKQKQFKSQKEVKDFFDKELFTSSGAFKAGGQDKANQLLSWMGFKPEEIPAEAAKLKQKIRDEIINAPLSQSQEMANKMQAGAKKFLDKDYTKAVKDNETLIKKDQGYIEAEKALKNSESTLNKKTNDVDTLQTNLSTQQLIYQQIQQLEAEIDSLWQKLEGDEAASNKVEFDRLKQNIRTEEENLKKQVQNNYTKQDIDDAAKVNQNVRGYKDAEDARLQTEQEAANFKANLQSSIKHWMGAQQVITLVRQGIRQAYQDIQGLDKAMTNIAVVTDFNVSDLWGKINDYMQVAQQYGVTTQGVYEVSQLYFQQGLGEADTMAATTETLKMARIAGMDYAEAADGMTVAIRGFNMEMQDAARVTDVYSKVAAITASDTQELVTAMSKTASSAASVGSSFEDTTAMLAVMVEATRESPQNIGSAMKSIISRYGEMTKGLSADSEGEEIDYNRVDTALKSVGISLKDAQGQFRNFNEVIFELADTWDTLDSVTQRYIATIFAGNRQQSRFLALVSNADRLREVSEAAANSEDAGLLQYSKTLDSLETKLNNIKTSFQQFYMSLINGDNVKGLLDFINDLIKGLNKLSKFTSILNFGSIVIAVKTIGNLLINGFTSGMSQIQTNWRMTMQQLVEIARKGGIDSANAFNSGAQGMGKGGAGKQGGFSTGSKALLNGGLMLGGALSLYGTSLAQKNQTAGAIVSGIGNMTTYGIQGGLMGMAMGGPLGATIGAAAGALGGLISMISSIPNAIENAQQKLEQAQEKVEQANIKRAEAKQKVDTLESGKKQLEKLKETQFDDEESMEKWIDANNTLAESFPQLISHFDEAGNAIISLTAAEDALREAREEAASTAKQAALEELKAKKQELLLEQQQAEAAKMAVKDTSFWGGGTTNRSRNITLRGITREYLEQNGIAYTPQMTGTGGFGNALSLTVGNDQISNAFTNILDYTNPEALKWMVEFANLRTWPEASEKLANDQISATWLKDGKTTSDFIKAITGGKYTDYSDFTSTFNGQDLLKVEKQLSALSKNLISNYLNSDLILIEEDFEEIIGTSKIGADYLLKQMNAAGISDTESYVQSSEYFTDLENFKAKQKVLYDTLFSVGKIDEFNELISKMDQGEISYSDFAKMAESYAGEASNLYVEYYKENFQEVQERFYNSLKSKNTKWTNLIGNEPIKYDQEGNILEISEQLYSFSEKEMGVITAFANKIGDMIDGQIITADQGQNIVDAYSNLWNIIQTNLDGNLQTVARNLLSNADLTSITGIMDLKAALEEEGIDVSQFDFSGIINNLAVNVVTEYEALNNKLATNLESVAKALNDASNGISSPEEALKLANRLGVSISEFRVEDGKFYYDDIANIREQLGQETEAIKTQLETAYESYIQAAEGLLNVDWLNEGTGESLETKQNFLNSRIQQLSEKKELTDKEETELQSLLKQRDVLNTFSEGYQEFIKIAGNSDTSFVEYIVNHRIEELKAVDAQLAKWYEQQADEIAKNNAINNLIKSYGGGERQEALNTLASTGGLGLSAEELAKLEANYFGTEKSEDGTVKIKGHFKTVKNEDGTYNIDYSAIENLEQWVQTLISQVVHDSVESAKDDIKDLAEKVGSGTAKQADYTKTFTYYASFMSPEALQETLQQPEFLKNAYAYEMAHRAGDASKWMDYLDEATELVEETNAITIDASRENLLRFYELSQKKILGTITEQESEELGDFNLDTTEFTGNLISQLTQHAQAIIDGLASGTIVDFDAATDTLEKDMTAALSAKAYAKEFNIDESLIEGMDSLTLAYFSDAMETVRKSKNQFDADSAGKIATSIATMMGAGEEVASKVLDLFAYDLEEHSFSLELPSSFDELKEAFGLEENGAAATAIEQAYANQQKQVAYARKGQNRSGVIAGALSMTDVKAFTRGTFEQAEEAIKNDASLSEEAKQKALAEVQALIYFWEAAGEAEISGELEKFDESRAFIDGLKSTYETLASGEEITAAELKEIYDQVGFKNYTAESLQNTIKGGSIAILNKIQEAIEWGAAVGDIDAKEAKSRIAELQATILDAIISNISSGISSLGEGIEGTLSNQDWNSLIEKYSGLKSADVTRTIKGVKLSDSAQLQLATAQYSEALSKGASGWDFAEQLWEVAEGADSAFGSIEAIEKALEGATGEAKQLLQQLLNIAMLDEDDPMFNFMEQDPTDGRTANFDNFVNQIESVKSAFASFKSEGEIGYREFMNMMDFMNQYTSESDGINSFIKQVNDAGFTFEEFVNRVVTNAKTFGKVDIGGVAAEMGISVEAAMEGMAEGMTDGLKAIAKKQIQYLSGLEAMLEALLAFESIGNVEAGIDFSFNITGSDEPITIKDLTNLWDEYQKLPEVDKKRFVLEFDKYIKESGTDNQKNLWSTFTGGFVGDGSDPSALFGMDYIVTAQEQMRANGTLQTFQDNMAKMTREEAMAISEALTNTEGLYDKEGKLVKDWEKRMEARYNEMLDSVLKGNWREKYGESFSDILSEGMAGKGTIGGEGWSLNLGEINKDTITFTGLDDKDLSLGEEALKEKITETLNKQYESKGLKVDGIEINAETGEVKVNFKKIPFDYSDFDSKVKEAFGDKFKGGDSESGYTVELDGQVITLELGKNGIKFKLPEGMDETGAQNMASQIASLFGATAGEGTLEGGSYEFSLVPKITPAEDGGLSTLESDVNAIKETLTNGLVVTIDSTGATNAFTEIESAYKNLKTTLEGSPINVKVNAPNGTNPQDPNNPAVPGQQQGPATATVTDVNVPEGKTIDLKGEVSDVDTSGASGEEVELTGQVSEIEAPELEEQEQEISLTYTDAGHEPDVQPNPTDVVITYTDNGHKPEVQPNPTDVSITYTDPGHKPNVPSSVTVKVEYDDPGAPGAPKWTGNVNNVTGSAFANGNVATLTAGAKLANKTLVGELGPELAVYNGQYHLLGQTGAEFVELPDDALIFNHLQTAGIISGQMKNARAQAFKGRADAAIAKSMGSAMATGNVTGPAFASGIAGALAAVRRAKSVWQGLLNTLSAADLMGAGGGGGGGGGDDNSLKAHIEDLQEWYNLSRQIAKIEQEINTLLAKRKNITDGHEYLKNLRETQKLLTQQVATQQVLVKYQQAQLEAQAQHINTHSIWSQFLTVGEDGLLQYKDGNETNGGKGSLSVLQQMNQMSGEEQVAFLAKLGYSYTDNDGKKLEGEELVAKFFEELQKQIDDYDALADAVAEAEEAMADLEAEIAEIEREIRDNEIELGQNIYDVMVAAWEENIKNLKEQNELIKEANEAYANGIQEAIDAERQMYEQNRAISDREQLQRQLALLRRSGGSASEIADLESQLDDMLKDEYFANQEDALETIRDANERQVELMDQQVKLEEEALEYEKENGVIWTKVYEVMQGTDAEILSFLSGNDPGFFEKQKLEQEDMLTEWAKKIGIYTEERQRQNYIKELDTNSFNNALASADGKTDYTSTYNKLDDSEKKTLKDLFERTYGDARIDGKSEAEALKLANEAVQKFLEDWKKAQDAASKPPSSNGGGSSGGSSGGNSSNSSGSSSKKADYHYIKVGNDFIGVNSSGSKSSIVSYIAKASGLSKEEVEKQLKTSKRYASGGLVNYTGPAWVDGSKSKPERILSAEQNKILEEGLAMNAGRSDKLREMFSNFAENLGASVRASISNIINRTSGSAITIQPGAVQLNIEQLNDKYDVDELFNDVADRLYSIASKASGRGVNRR